MPGGTQCQSVDEPRDPPVGSSLQSCAEATTGGFARVVRPSAAAVGGEDDSLPRLPVGVEAVTPLFGPPPRGPPLLVPVSLAASGAIGSTGDAGVVGLAGDTLGLPGDESASWVDPNHVRVAMNVRNSPPAIRAPIASGRDDLMDATGRDSSYDGRTGGSACEAGAGASRSSAIDDAPDESMAFPRAVQNSSRFFRLVATKG
jgi:hypothetical protein